MTQTPNINNRKYVQTLFQLIDCDISKRQDLSKNEGVTDSNLMTYTTLIEDRFLQINHAYGIIMSDVIYLSNVKFKLTTLLEEPQQSPN
jgi:hypothetical protein